ncbi:MAG: hypothetical protein O2820_19965 [Planctomycetota bacterium]|nr:hypothetical protein [Planctomycetota bacterium]MDA1251493.1 hypothetical protein [Planctomycetota bacterium]
MNLVKATGKPRNANNEPAGRRWPYGYYSLLADCVFDVVEVQRGLMVWVRTLTLSGTTKAFGAASPCDVKTESR